MKKLLSIIGAIILITSVSSNLISCDNKNIENNKSEPTPEQLPETSNWKLIDTSSKEKR